jgi:hypothetical protein
MRCLALALRPVRLLCWQSRGLLAWIALGGALSGGCDSCSRAQERNIRVKRTSLERCSVAADCSPAEPCTEQSCVAGECQTALLPKGKSCDNETVCDGVARCDDRGRCVPGTPPVLDDGNACTLDSCDPARGVVHEPVPSDDFDACTSDVCDRKTGRITHTTLSIDDGNDCTFDNCDPKKGVSHQQPSPFYSCQASCGPGFHATSRSPSPACVAELSLQTFCAPNCGASFYSCEPSCPSGYHSSSRAMTTRCGDRPSLQTFCTKNSGDSFHTCDASCPSGYQKHAQREGGRCGTGPSRMTFCVKG